jgi:hypothetical protein
MFIRKYFVCVQTTSEIISNFRNSGVPREHNGRPVDEIPYSAIRYGRFGVLAVLITNQYAIVVCGFPCQKSAWRLTTSSSRCYGPVAFTVIWYAYDIFVTEI